MKKEPSKTVNIEIGFQKEFTTTVARPHKHLHLGAINILPAIQVDWFSIPCVTIPDERPAKFEATTLSIRFLVWHLEVSYSWIRKTR